MKVQKKRLIALVLVLVMLLSVGCGQEQNTTDRVTTDVNLTGSSVEGTSEGSLSGVNVSDGQRIHGFQLVKEEEIQDIASTMYLYMHEKTGAEVIWIKNADPFKVFAACYKTEPTDNKGSAHIVEHALLGGSRKYSSNDIFNDMNAISTNAFMNAYTYPDKTIFPVASRDPKDFANLTDLYLDAVFFPKIAEEKSIFQQEGWHYDIFDKSEPITYTGVVYNEMRGAMADPIQVLFRKILAALYPDTCYAFNFGGEPDVIPELSYEEFLEFYNRFYHPSNLLMYFYGDVDMDYFLKSIDEEYLAEFEKKEIDVRYEKQKAFEKMNVVESSYSIGADEDPSGQTYISYNINCGDGGNPIDYYLLAIISDALVDANYAPIKNALLEENIGQDNGSFRLSFNQNTFGVIAMYANPEDSEKLVEIVDRELQRVAAEGFDKDILYAIISQIELDMRAAEGEEGLKGLSFLDSVLNAKFYGAEPAAYLRFDGIIKTLKEGVESGLFENFVNEKLLGHNHKSLVILKPEPGLLDKKNADAVERLKHYKDSLSEADLDAIIAENIANEQKKDASAESTLPKLNLKDINTDIYSIDYETLKTGPAEMLFSEQPTNGLIYLDLQFDLSTVDEDKVPYASLLADLMCNLDTENFSYGDLETAINLVSGGMDVGTMVAENISDGKMDSRFTMSTMSTPENLDAALDLVYEVGTRTLYDDYDRIGTQISQLRLEMENELNTDGVGLGLLRVRSYFSPMFKYLDTISGMTYLRFLQKLDEEFRVDPEAVCEEFKQIAGTVLNQNNLVIGVAAEKTDFARVQSSLDAFIQRLPEEKHENGKFDMEVSKLNEAIPTTADINYVVMAGNLRNVSEDGLDGASNLLTNLIDNLYLYPELRQKGGAYGAYSIIDNYGNLVLYTYRDPNIAESLDVLKRVGDFVSSLEIGEEDLEQMIIGFFKAYPVTPSSVASDICYRHLNGITDEDYRQAAEEVKNTKLEDIRKYGKIINTMLEDQNFIVIGNEKKVEELNDLFDNIFTITPSK